MKKMNQLRISVCVTLGLIGFCLFSHAQESKETIRKEMILPSTSEIPWLQISNINGAIEVEGYNGDAVLFEIEKIIEADDNEALSEGKEDMKVNFTTKDEYIIAYIDCPYCNFDLEKTGKGSRNHWDWQYKGSYREVGYQYTFNFKVKVPKNVNLNVSTINQGDVTVRKIEAETIRANNVNGAVSLQNISGTTKVHTVNGDITINYIENPERRSTFKTVNGDINVYMNNDLSADVGFQSMNGDLFTDFDEVSYLPSSLETSKEKNGKKTTYKIANGTSIRIGEGGVKLQFDTLNGDVFIKKNKL